MNLQSMRPPEIALALLLVGLIVIDVPFPALVSSFIGSMPGVVTLIGVVFYLFAQNLPVLGVLAFIASYAMVQRTGTFIAADFMPKLAQTEDAPIWNQHSVSLEETMIQNLVPMVHDTTSPHSQLQFSGSAEETHDAADV